MLAPLPLLQSYLRPVGARCLVRVSRFIPLTRAGSARYLVGGPPSPPPLVSAHVSRALPFREYSPLVFVLLLATRKERVLPVFPSFRPVSVVFLGLYPLPWGFVAVGLPSGSSGASNLYLRRASAMCLCLAPSAPSGCLCSLTSFPPSSPPPHCGICGASGSCLIAISSQSLLLPHPLLSWVAGEFLSPPRPVCLPQALPCPSGVPLEYLSTHGNSSTPGVLVPLGNSTPPPNPWRSLMWFSTTLEALGASSLNLTSEY